MCVYIYIYIYIYIYKFYLVQALTCLQVNYLHVSRQLQKLSVLFALLLVLLGNMFDSTLGFPGEGPPVNDPPIATFAPGMGGMGGMDGPY